MHHAIDFWGVSASSTSSAVLINMVNDQGLLGPDLCSAFGGADLLLSGHKTLPPILLNLVSNWIRELICGRTRNWRVLKAPHIIELRGINKVE